MARFYSLFLFIFIQFYYFTFSYAQVSPDATYNHITSSGGIKDNYISLIYQDSTGNIWIATSGGLYCFDGNEFLRYLPNYGHHQINVIFQVAHDRIWIGSKDGILEISLKTQKLRRVNPEIAGIADIKRDRSQNNLLWISTSIGLMIFNLDKPLSDNKDEVNYETDLRISFPNLTLIAFFNDKQVMCATLDGRLLCFNKQDERVHNLEIIDIEKQDNIPTITKIIVVPGGIASVGSMSGLYQFTIKEEYFQSDSKLELKPRLKEIITDMVIDKDHRIWIGTLNNSLFCQDRANSGLIKHFPAGDPLNRWVLSDHTTSLFIDRDQNLWLGTNENGLVILDPDSPGIINEAKNYPSLLYQQEFTSLWIGENEEFFIAPNLYFVASRASNEILKSGLFEHEIKIFTSDFTTGSNGFYTQQRNDLIHNIMSYQDTIDISLPIGMDLQFISSHSDSLIILGDKNGELFKFNFEKQKAKKIRWQLKKMLKEMTPIIGTIPLDINRILVITNKLVYVCEIENDLIVDIIRLFEENEFNHLHSGFSTYYMTTNKILCLGTIDHGIIVFNLITSEHSIYTTQEGLCHNSVSSIVEDFNHDIWIGTANGLTQLDLNTNSLTNYFIQDGLPGNQFLRSSVAKAHDGRLYFGTKSGLLIFHPALVRPKKDSGYPVAIKAFINNLPYQIDAGRGIILTYKQKSVLFKVSPQNFVQPNIYYYAFKLNGAEDDWIYSGHNNNISYSSLPSGKYSLEIMVSENGSLWQLIEEPIQIRVKSPPWFSVHAYILYAILALIIIYLFKRWIDFRYKMNQKIVEEQLKSEHAMAIDGLRSNMYSYLIHELQTPLSLIIDPMRKILEDPKSKDLKFLYHTIISNKRRIQELSDQLIQISKLKVPGFPMRPKITDFRSILERSLLSFEFSFKEKHLTISSELPTHECWIKADENMIEKVIDNLLSNAIKYNVQNGAISVVLKYKEDKTPDVGFGTYILSISDTGIGIKKHELPAIFEKFFRGDKSKSESESNGYGIGLALCKEFVFKNNGEISIKSLSGSGTSIIVSFKCVRLPEITSQSTINDIRSSKVEHYNKKDPSTAMDVQKPQEGSSDYCLLIIDDDENLLEFLKHTLQSEYQIITSSNSFNVLSLISNITPDLIILDIMMPGINGLELCKKIKQNPAINHIPILILSALSDAKSRVEGYKNLANGFITKPFRIDALKLRIENLIRQRSLQRESFKREFLNIKPGLSQMQLKEQFLKKVKDCILEHIDEQDYNIKELSREIGISRTQLYRKIQSTTGMGPSEFIMLIRLRYASTLLLNNQLTIQEIAFMSGFNSASYFSRKFHSHFHKTPKEYQIQSIMDG